MGVGGQLRKISPHLRFDALTVQLVARGFIDYAIPVHYSKNIAVRFTL
jgi:hypothetical protein